MRPGGGGRAGGQYEVDHSRQQISATSVSWARSKPAPWRSTDRQIYQEDSAASLPALDRDGAIRKKKGPWWQAPADLPDTSEPYGASAVKLVAQLPGSACQSASRLGGLGLPSPSVILP